MKRLYFDWSYEVETQIQMKDIQDSCICKHNSVNILGSDCMTIDKVCKETRQDRHETGEMDTHCHSLSSYRSQKKSRATILK